MKKTLATVLAFSLAASAAYAGGPNAAEVDSSVENANNNDPYAAAPSFGLMAGGAGVGVAVAAAALAVGVALAAGEDNSDDSTSTPTSGTPTE